MKPELTCNVCFYPVDSVVVAKSLTGGWSIVRCEACAELNAEPLNELEDKVRFGLAPNWLYYLVTYQQNPRSKGGSYFVFSEIAG